MGTKPLRELVDSFRSARLRREMTVEFRLRRLERWQRAEQWLLGALLLAGLAKGIDVLIGKL
jgi:hypothetical protein